MKQIKEVCELSGLSRRTLQFYDERGLLNVKRTEGNYRVYEQEDIYRLWLILIYKEMGCSLNEISNLLDADEEMFRVILTNKMLEIEAEISELERRYRFIDKVMTYGVPDCDIDAVEKGDMSYAEYAKILSERL